MSDDLPGALMVGFGEDLTTKDPFAGLPPPSADTRAPREVFAEACAEIGKRFEPDGFQYFKSKKSLKKKQADIQLVIHLETSSWNIRGITVLLRPNVQIYSTTLSEWRKEHRKFAERVPYNGGNWEGVTGSALHNTISETLYKNYPPLFQWNLAYIENRTAVIDDIESALRSYALTYFDSFLNPSTVLERLVYGGKDCRSATSVPGLHITEALEYALCFGTVSHAAAILHRKKELLANLSGTEVERRFQTFTQPGLPRDFLEQADLSSEIEEIREHWDV